MEPEESEEEFVSATTATTIKKQKKERNDDGMQNTSWKPELSEFAIATLVFVCFLGIIFVGLGCVFLMILGWMSYAMFFLMAFGLVGCLVFLFMDPCSLMLAKRIRKRRRSSGNKNFDSSSSWTEMISMGAPKVRTGMKKNRRRKTTTRNKKETDDQESQPSPDPCILRSSPPPPPLSADSNELNT